MFQGMQDDKPRQIINEKIKSLPNGLKKRLISNLILDAVLDKAMSEKFPDSPPEQPQAEEEEEEKEKENKESPSDKPVDKKKTKNVRKGKGKKSDKSEENGLEDGESSIKSDSTDLAESCVKSEGETEQKISSDICDGSSDMTDGIGTIVPDLGNKPPPDLGPKIEINTEQQSAEEPGNPVIQTSRLKEEEEKVPTPVQHSVFKSFFSTELSFDDIDRQIKAKRVELVSFSFCLFTSFYKSLYIR